MNPAIAWLMQIFDASKAKSVAWAYRDRLHPDQPMARLVLEDLAVFCHANTTTYRADDPHAINFHEGQRSVYLHIAQMLELHPSELPTPTRGD